MSRALYLLPLFLRTALGEWPPALPAGSPNISLSLCAGSLGSLAPLLGAIALPASPAASVFSVDVFVTTDGAPWAAFAAAALAPTVQPPALPSNTDGWPLILTWRYAGSATANAPAFAKEATFSLDAWARTADDAFASFAVAYVSRAGGAGATSFAAVAAAALGGAVVTRHVPVTEACSAPPAILESSDVFAAKLGALLNALPSVGQAALNASPTPRARGGVGELGVVASAARPTQLVGVSIVLAVAAALAVTLMP